MQRSKRTSQLLNFRESSPIPMRSPSPDFATKNIIVSTKIPSTAQITKKLNSSYHSQKRSIEQELENLKMENHELRNQISYLKNEMQKNNYGSLESTDRIGFSRLIAQKQKQIQNLKNQLKEAKESKPTLSNKKISLTKSIFPQNRQYNNQIPQDWKLVRNQSQHIKKLQQRVGKLEQQNQQLKKVLSKNRLSQGGRSRKIFEDQKIDLKQLKFKFQNQINNNMSQIQNIIKQLSKKIDESQMKLKKLQNYQNKLGQTIKKTNNPTQKNTTNSAFKKILESSPMARGDSGKIHSYQQDQSIKQIQQFNVVHITPSQQKIVQQVQQNQHIKQLQEQLQQKSLQNKRLVQQMSKLKSSLRNSNRRGISLSPDRSTINQLQNLKKQNNQLRQENKKLLKSKDTSNIQQKYDMEIQRLKNELQMISNQKNGQLQQLKKQNKNLRQAIKNQNNAQHQRIQQQIDYLRKQHQDLRQINKKIANQNAILKKQIQKNNRERMYESNKKVDPINIELAGKLKALQKQYIQLNGELVRKKNQQSINPQDYNILRKKLAQLQKILLNKNQEQQKLRQSNQYLQRQYRKKSDENEIMRLKMYGYEQIKQQLQKQLQQNKQLSNTNQNLLLQIRNLTEQIQQNNKINKQRLIEQMEYLEKQNNKLKELEQKRKQQLKNDVVQLKQLHQLIKALDIQPLEKNVEQSFKINKPKTKQISNLNAYIQRLKKQLIKLQLQKSNLAEQNKNLAAKIRQLNADIQILKQTQENHIKIINEYIQQPSIIENLNNIEQDQESSDELAKSHIKQIKRKVNKAIDILNNLNNRAQNKNVVVREE